MTQTTGVIIFLHKSDKTTTSNRHRVVDGGGLALYRCRSGAVAVGGGHHRPPLESVKVKIFSKNGHKVSLYINKTLNTTYYTPCDAPS